ncbi:MAG TPA: class F sortase [Mycobacteriales bacterium]|nr:class F sortase [Mycobacteriales bacterium]
MPSADAGRWATALPSLIGYALSVQLLVAAGALAGPFALEPEDRARNLPPGELVTAAGSSTPGSRAGAGRSVAGPVSLSPRLVAPNLWSGSVPTAPLQVQADGALAVPATAGALGWWAGGVPPGALGAAVVVGHADLDGAAGVFARLGRARPGMTVTVELGAAAVHFRIVAVSRHPKNEFPTAVVYRPSDQAELRLVTCGGRFDPRTGHYADNIVVRAVRA